MNTESDGERLLDECFRIVLRLDADGFFPEPHSPEVKAMLTEAHSWTTRRRQQRGRNHD